MTHRRHSKKGNVTTTNSLASAKSAGLYFVHDDGPGLRRVRSGKGFRYLDSAGKRIRDAGEIKRIQALAIPPAWTKVWICPRANGHLQATGRDARGRKQYRYHPEWRSVRDETKYERVLEVAQALPRLRSAIKKDLARPGLPRAKVLATVVRLLETTLIRVGNQEYARQNGSFGLTTLRDQHVEIAGATMRFEFRGKSGIKHSITLQDRRLAHIVWRCQAVPGNELFQYFDQEGRRQPIESADVNAYLRDKTGQDFTAKDFRTWAGTVLAVRALLEHGKFTSERQAKKHIVAAVACVAEQLRNTKAVCRKCYIHPAVLDGFMDRSLFKFSRLPKKNSAGLTAEEQMVLAFLEKVRKP